MIERESEIKELYDLRHRKDNIERGFDYENQILKKTLSGVIYKNPNLSSFLEQLRVQVVLMIDSVVVVRNFWNYTVDKYYDRHNN